MREYKGRNFGKKTNKSFAGSTSWAKTQKMLHRYVNGRKGSRGKSANEKSCTNCIKLLHKGLSTRDCFHHAQACKAKN